MKLAFTDAARSDLLSIGDYIADDNPWRAVTFLEELEARCASIVHFPNSHALLAGRKGRGIRCAVHSNYRIFYTVADNTVRILRILNSAMDHERVLFADDPSSQ